MKPNTATHLNWSIDEMYLYLSHAVICIPAKYQEQVANDMAYKLIEWNNTPRSVLRKAMNKYGYTFKENCTWCNENLPHWDDDEDNNPMCSSCKREKAAEDGEEDGEEDGDE